MQELVGPVCSDSGVRIATWNCCGKYDENLRHLLDENVDVAVVCEAAARPGLPAHGGRAVTGVSQRVWSESYRELAVVAREPWSVARHEAAATAPAWLLPARIAGPIPFTLLGVWTVKYTGSLSYENQLRRVADWLEMLGLEGPVVVAGDFNSPISTSQAQYDEVERRFLNLGMVDAYAASRGLSGGEARTEATYYQHRRQHRPFHIDHVFLPVDWAGAVDLQVGDFPTWIESGRSDHVPLIADLDDPAA
jgi:endonuclease/exonuclease/phosphatase (EEP) superfamily protein YafD